jgi:archaemetzincin
MIHLLPIGVVSKSILESLASSLKKVYKISAGIHEPVSLPASSYDPERHQYSSDPILKGLARFKATLTQVERVLGIVGVDLYAEDLNFVFGEADPKEGVAVISLWRLRPEYSGLPPDKALYHQRVFKEAVHELGHTYCLGHCPDPACVMHFSDSIQDTDKKTASFCAECDSQRLKTQS